MAIRMGIQQPNIKTKRQFRYIFSIPEICGYYPEDGLSCKIHERTARPNISFKDLTVEHLAETITFPGKVSFEPINLTLWDNYPNSSESVENPIWKWMLLWYSFNRGKYNSPTKGFKKTCVLKLYDGCGCEIEKWIYENAYPQTINFGDLDMGQSEICRIDITLKYDRAYLF